MVTILVKWRWRSPLSRSEDYLTRPAQVRGFYHSLDKRVYIDSLTILLCIQFSIAHKCQRFLVVSAFTFEVMSFSEVTRRLVLSRKNLIPNMWWALPTLQKSLI